MKNKEKTPRERVLNDLSKLGELIENNIKTIDGLIIENKNRNENIKQAGTIANETFAPIIG